MVTANELLKSLTNSEAEGHVVIGIDRRIAVPASLKRIAVQYDHNIETVTFDCPRYWDGLDMSQMAVYINYMRSDGYTDSYPVGTVTVDSTDSSIMHFNWTISRNVTEVAGAISFLVCIKNTDGEGNEVNHWNSELCQDLTVSPGMEADEQYIEYQSDLITQLLLRMDTVEEINITVSEAESLLAQTKSAKEEAEDARDIALDESDHIKNSYANAFKGGATGEIICVDDVSPIEHDVKCWVRGKNLLDPNNIVKMNAVDVTYTEPNLTIKRTNTTEKWSNIYLGIGNYAQFVGKTLTLSVDNLNEYAWSIMFVIMDNTGSILQEYGGKAVKLGHTSTAVTIPNISGATALAIRIVSGDNSVATGETCVLQNIQVELGPVATEYEPYIDPTTITVTGCGKNLLKYPYYNLSATSQGVTFADNGSGGIAISGTPTGAAGLTLASNAKLPCTSGILTFSISGVVNNIILQVEIQNSAGEKIFATQGSSFSVNLDNYTSDALYTLYIKREVNDVICSGLAFPQIELGSEATDYEPYTGATYTPASDGIVEVTSNSPTMTIFTNTPGVIVEAEYNRDTSILNTVYIGSGDMPSGYNIHINPDGSAFELPETDQTYNPESENAQSGTAVAEALGTVIPNDFEVIAEGELTESVNTILIDKDKDGNSLALQDIVSFYFYSPIHTKMSTVTININSKLVAQVPTMKNTGENYSKAFSIYTGCHWETFHIDGAWIGYAPVQHRGINPLAPQDAKTHNRVNTIKLYCYNSEDIFPIGFKYKIYGRRAK